MNVARLEGDLQDGYFWRLIASQNEPKLYLSFFNQREQVSLPDFVVDLDEELKGYKKDKYLNSEDFEFGVELFAKITQLPVEFLYILRNGKVSLCDY